MKNEYLKYISEQHLEVFKKIQNTITKLPDLDCGIDEFGEKIIITCHSLSCAIAEKFDLIVEHGMFYPNFQHSWIRLSDGTIIDPYPVCTIGGPILVIMGPTPMASTNGWLYLTKGEIYEEWAKSISEKCLAPSFRRTVELIKQHL